MTWTWERCIRVKEAHVKGQRKEASGGWEYDANGDGQSATRSALLWDWDHTPIMANMGTIKWLVGFAMCSVVLVGTMLGVDVYSERALYSVVSPLRRGLDGARIIFVARESTSSSSPPLPAAPPRLGYLISGSKGDGERLKRTLQAFYHPLNQYVVHLDLESSPKERANLSNYLSKHPIFAEAGNVHMISKANLVTYRGPTMVSNTLHAAAILLRRSQEWDWFINLSASDYPLVTQDDLLHAFSYLPRTLNFIGYTSNLGWKEQKRAKPMIIDPGLYRFKKSDVFWLTEKRSLPTAFKLFTGYDTDNKRTYLAEHESEGI